MHLPSSLKKSALITQTSGANREPSFGLGWPGLCAATPSFDIAIFDDSGSITRAGGTDPVGNRYVEATAAFAKLGAWCSCKHCLAAVVHFDTPNGDSDFGPLASRRFQQQLKNALADPLGGGQSFISSSLDRADGFVENHPRHRMRMIIFSDWELFDSTDYVSRLVGFPGEVLAIGLNRTPPATLVGPSITALRIDYQDKPGTVARAMFAGITAGRRGKS